VSFSLSQYFNVTGFSYSQVKSTPGVDEDHDGIYEVEPTYNFEYTTNGDGTTDVVIKNISLRPSAENLTGHLGIQLKLTPKNTFAGGNDVPLLASPNMCPSELRGNDIADQWKEQKLWGRTFSVPVREKFRENEDGTITWETAGGAICPKGAFFFDGSSVKIKDSYVRIRSFQYSDLFYLLTDRFFKIFFCERDCTTAKTTLFLCLCGL